MHLATKWYVDQEVSGSSTPSFWTANGTNLSNSTTGNVGIGTTTPTTKLQVAGSIAASGNVTANGNMSASGNMTASDPTANNHLATKAYVDSVVSAAGRGGGGSGGGGFQNCTTRVKSGTMALLNTDWSRRVSCSSGQSIRSYQIRCSNGGYGDDYYANPGAMMNCDIQTFTKNSILLKYYNPGIYMNVSLLCCDD